MDPKLIEQKQFAERYLFGRLTPPEAKFFEGLVKKSPELAERMGLPAALQRTMRLLDETGTEWQERAPKFWHRPWVVLGLGALCLAALAATVSLMVSKNQLNERYLALRAEAERGLFLAPNHTRVLRIQPAARGEQVSSYPIGTRADPSLAELRFDLGLLKATLFRVVIKRDDGSYWGRLDNQVKDSNGELRIALNSGAFAAGSYDVEIDQVNLRGDGEPVGFLELSVAAR
jgi:hypothetical protein